MVRILVSSVNKNIADVESEVNGTREEIESELLLAIRRAVRVLSEIDKTDFESTLDSIYVYLLTNHKE